MISSKTDKVWVGWLAGAIGSFAALERYAIKHKEDTLSRCTWKAAQAWSPLAVIYGMIFGGLAIHFFWTPSTSSGPHPLLLDQ